MPPRSPTASCAAGSGPRSPRSASACSANRSCATRSTSASPRRSATSSTTTATRSAALIESTIDRWDGEETSRTDRVAGRTRPAVHPHQRHVGRRPRRVDDPYRRRDRRPLNPPRRTLTGRSQPPNQAQSHGQTCGQIALAVHSRPIRHNRTARRLTASADSGQRSTTVGSGT